MKIIITRSLRYGISLRAMRPETKEALWDVYYSKKNIPNAAQSCGLTNKEMKIIFSEFCRLHEPDYNHEINTQD